MVPSSMISLFLPHRSTTMVVPTIFVHDICTSDCTTNNGPNSAPTLHSYCHSRNLCRRPKKGKEVLFWNVQNFDSQILEYRLSDHLFFHQVYNKQHSNAWFVCIYPNAFFVSFRSYEYVVCCLLPATATFSWYGWCDMMNMPTNESTTNLATCKVW